MRTTPATVRRGLLLVAGMLCLAGCRSASPGTAAGLATPRMATQAQLPAPIRLPAVEHDAVVRLVSAHEELPDGATPDTSASSPADAEPVPPGQPNHLRGAASPQPLPLSLFDAIETSLRRNPDLTALRQAEGVSIGALGVARTYPFNPYVQVQVTPWQERPGTGPGTTSHYVLVMQTLQLAHQQRHREEAALAALSSVRWNILQAELNNIAQTERLVFTALYLRGLRGLARANADMNRQLLTVIEKQLAAGAATGADVAIVRLDNRSAGQQAALADANYQTALLDLRRQLNLPLDFPCELAGELEDIRWNPAACPSDVCHVADQSQSSLIAAHCDRAALADLVAGRPDVLAAHADLSAANSNANLANSARMPDLQIGPYYLRSDADATFLGFRAQMDIPVWNNGVPLLRQRQAEVRQRRVVWMQLQSRAQIEAAAAIDRYERARRLANQSGLRSAAPLPLELRRLEEQFRAGDIDMLRVVTARTSLIQVQRAYLDSLNELAQAAAAVTAATAIPPQVLLEPEPPIIQAGGRRVR